MRYFVLHNFQFMSIHSAILCLSFMSNKMRIIFRRFNDTYFTYYSSAKCLADDKITVLFRGRVIFISIKHKSFGIKLTHQQFGLGVSMELMQEDCGVP